MQIAPQDTRFMQGRGLLNSAGFMAGIDQIGMQDVANAYTGDLIAIGQEQDRLANEQQDRMGLFNAQWQAGQGFLLDSIERAGLTTQYGRGLIGAGQQALQDAGEEARETTAQGVQAVADLVSKFSHESETLRSAVDMYASDVMANARNNSAVLLAQASDGVLAQTQQLVQQMEAQMLAQGVPIAQVQNQVAQIRAQGAKTLGDMRNQIGVAENDRLTRVEADMAKMRAQTTNTLINAWAGVTTAAGSEVMGGAKNLATIQAGLAQANAELNTNAAYWATQDNASAASIRNVYATFATMGAETMFNMVSQIHLPVLEWGGVLDGLVNMSEGAEVGEYQLAMQEFGVSDAISSRMVNAFMGALDTQLEYGMWDHQLELQQHIASQNRTASTASSIAGSAMGMIKIPMGGATTGIQSGNVTT
jgi:hypothetical protein